MKIKTRDHEVRQTVPGDPAGDPMVAGTPGLGALAADRLAAADAAVARLMSGNAEQFLRANRQEGGQ